MRIRPLQTLIAHKVINLSELSGTEKRIAGAIVESFNRRTFQCDPSLSRIAKLAGVSRRTVMRAIAKLTRIGMIRKDRHGGHFQRNSYEPSWGYFRQMDAEWNGRFKERTHARVQNLSPAEGQGRHASGVDDGTQTCLKNLPKETCRADSSSERARPSALIGPKGHSRGASGAALPSPKGRASFGDTTSSSEAARIAAQRRWSEALHQKYGSRQEIYAAIIDALDEDLQNAATEAEMLRRGAGLILIEKELASRAMRCDETNGEAAR